MSQTPVAPLSRQRAVPKFLAPFVSRDLDRRDLALDAFRGLMILGMILVNHPGASGAVYGPLAHAAWTGWTLADVIAPGFLFAVGASLRFALTDPAGRTRPMEPGLLGKILRRFLVLLALNFLLMNFPYYARPLLFGGTLAQIAWSYLFASIVFLLVPRRLYIAVVVCLLIIVQWLVMMYLPLAGTEHGLMTPEMNAARYLDEVVFARVFGPSWFTEGGGLLVLHGMGLPLLGSLASTLMGVLAGQWLAAVRPMPHRVSGLFAAGFALLVSGEAAALVIPVSKILWTGSYVLLMAGISLQTLALAYWLIDRGYRTWAILLQVAGANALFMYVFAQSLQRVLVYGRVDAGHGTSERLRQFVFDQYFAPWVSGQAGALAFAVVFLGICYAVVAVLYRRRIFFKL